MFIKIEHRTGESCIVSVEDAKTSFRDVVRTAIEGVGETRHNLKEDMATWLKAHMESFPDRDITVEYALKIQEEQWHFLNGFIWNAAFCIRSQEHVDI